MIFPLRGLCGPQAPSPMAGMAGMPPKTGGEIWRSRPNILYLQPYRFPAAGSAGQGIKRETGENPVQFPLLYAPPPVWRISETALFCHWSCGIGKVPYSGASQKTCRCRDIRISPAVNGLCVTFANHCFGFRHACVPFSTEASAGFRPCRCRLCLQGPVMRYISPLCLLSRNSLSCKLLFNI